MGRPVNANVVVMDPVTGARVYVEAGAVPPKNVASLLGEHLFTGSSTADGGIPPKAGKGSGRGAWETYAKANDVDVAADMNRDDIIAALDAAGIATAETVGGDEDDDNGEDVAPPPRGGEGSGREEWAAYADGKVDVTPDMGRDDIIAALDAAGVDTGADE